jgi:hypothetical protein
MKTFVVLLIWSDGYVKQLSIKAATPHDASEEAVDHCPAVDREALIRTVVVDAAPDAVKSYSVHVIA